MQKRKRISIRKKNKISTFLIVLFILTIFLYDTISQNFRVGEDNSENEENDSPKLIKETIKEIHDEGKEYSINKYNFSIFKENKRIVKIIHITLNWEDETPKSPLWKNNPDTLTLRVISPTGKNDNNETKSNDVDNLKGSIDIILDNQIPKEIGLWKIWVEIEDCGDKELKKGLGVIPPEEDDKISYFLSIEISWLSEGF